MEASQTASPHPTAVRLSAAADEMIRAEAARTGRSRSAVLRAVAEEGIRERAFPGIAFKGEESRRAWLIGSGLSVWKVIEAYGDFDESIERMSAETDVGEQQIRLALTYYKRFPEEIDRTIAANKEAAEKYKDLFPTFYVD